MALLVAVVVSGVRATGETPSTPSGSADRQRAALAQLAELEFEYQTGKIGEEDYRDLKPPLAREALRARGELEKEERPAGSAPPDEENRASRQ